MLIFRSAADMFPETKFKIARPTSHLPTKFHQNRAMRGWGRPYCNLGILNVTAFHRLDLYKNKIWTVPRPLEGHFCLYAKFGAYINYLRPTYSRVSPENEIQSGGRFPFAVLITTLCLETHETSTQNFIKINLSIFKMAAFHAAISGIPFSIHIPNFRADI